MKQKVFFILALLLMAATSAWAQTPTLLTTIEAASNSDFTSGSKTFDNIATVTFSVNVGYDEDWGWYPTGEYSETTITVTPVEGNTITSCKFYTDYGSTEDTQSPFEINMKYDIGPSIIFNGNEILGSGVTNIEVYGYKATKNAVALAEGTEDAANWTIDPAKAKENETVTLKYNGLMKVESITAVKKEAVARTLAEATDADLGKIVGADGNIYDTKDAAEAAGTTAVAMIAYVGSNTGYFGKEHGLAIALADEGMMNWDAARSACIGKPAVSGAEWLFPSEDKLKTMFEANGGYEDKFAGLNEKLATAGGDSSKLREDSFYWMYKEESPEDAYYFFFDEDHVALSSDNKESEYTVRAGLAF